MEKPTCFEGALDQVLEHIRETIIKKQKDYGKGNILEFGEFGVLVRSNDKFARLKNLILSNKNPENETIDDTWLDMAGYAILAMMLRNGTFELPMWSNTPSE